MFATPRFAQPHVIAAQDAKTAMMKAALETIMAKKPSKPNKPKPGC